MKITILLLSLLVISGCGEPRLVFLESLSAKQPRVVNVVPENGTTVRPDAIIRVTFSGPVSEGSINTYSFAVVENFENGPNDKIIGDLEDGDLDTVDGKYGFDATGEAVEFTPNENLSEGVNYGVIITTDVADDENLPLNDPYVGSFNVASGDETDVVQEDSNQPDNESGATDSNSETGEEESPGNTEDTTPPEPVTDIKVVINELYYDATASDTDGYLFVELKGDANGDVSKYKISFINGEDGKITENITLPDGATIGDDGLYVIADLSTGSKTETKVGHYDFLDNFDPQNGPDAAQLFDNNGELLDAICYGEPKVLKDENGFDICEGNFGPDAPAGKSITRTAGTADTNDNSTDFVINETPSPGVE